MKCFLTYNLSIVSLNMVLTCHIRSSCQKNYVIIIYGPVVRETISQSYTVQLPEKLYHNHIRSSCQKKLYPNHIRYSCQKNYIIIIYGPAVRKNYIIIIYGLAVRKNYIIIIGVDTKSITEVRRLYRQLDNILIA